jgi:hypothetical protein
MTRSCSSFRSAPSTSVAESEAVAHGVPDHVTDAVFITDRAFHNFGKKNFFPTNEESIKDGAHRFCKFLWKGSYLFCTFML